MRTLRTEVLILVQFSDENGFLFSERINKQIELIKRNGGKDITVQFTSAHDGRQTCNIIYCIGRDDKQ